MTNKILNDFIVAFTCFLLSNYYITKLGEIMTNKISSKSLITVSLFAALVFIFSYMSIPIPIGTDNTRLHLGNVMCLTSALVLGGKKGGTAAGLGSFIFDLSNPLYITSAPFTLVFKFLMGWSCGVVFWKVFKQKNTSLAISTSATVGSILYLVLFLLKGFIQNALLSMPFDANLLLTLNKGGISLVNAVIAVAVSVPLYKLINNRIKL